MPDENGALVDGETQPVVLKAQNEKGESEVAAAGRTAGAKLDELLGYGRFQIFQVGLLHIL